MKKLILFSLVGLCMLSCKTEPRTDYVINGTAKGLYNGIRVYLNTMDERGRMTAIDTAIVMNENFVLNGKVEYPSLLYLTVNGLNGRLPLMIGNYDMTLNIDNKIFDNSVLEGSKPHDILSNFNAELTNLKEKLNSASEDLRKSTFLRDTVYIEKDKATVEKLSRELTELPYKFIEDNSSSYGILPILKNQLFARDLDPEKFIAVYDKIDNALKNTSEGKSLQVRIQQVKAQLEAQKATAIGAKAPEFSAPTPDGNTLALSEVVKKSEITIIDFWAAWCGPCRRENPNVVSVYNDYHNKGLEIIGVGLDGRRGQQNPKEAWIKAIETDKLNWHQVSNLRYFDDIARLYNVNSIPSMFILDSNGKIIAKNLRGIALRNKISELLD
ncbi:MAG: AhpC/TSA family protein [Winogradskyella sp.]|uniref:TlpA disulfide reductase family protein n=1 Tax=Winogradskyella sp. TaxID=1883156 RepID=UPI000F3E390A|nr:TlpA disulfide reductase family protein [Winogradskyella sp.]RNC86348.1 MAG: AhpC/TSA family protein [Winogradskyella sp.]